MDTIELKSFATKQDALDLQFILFGGGVSAFVSHLPLEEDGKGWRWVVTVSEEDFELAKKILAEEGLDKSPEISTEPSLRTSRWAWHLTALLLLVNTLIWLAMEHEGGSTERQVLLRFGASYAPFMTQGQWWRLVTAIFLHIGLRHLLANGISLGVLAPPVIHAWGGGRFYFFYFVAGIGGNLFSYLLGQEASLKAGASGSILGLLGVLAGTRLRSIRSRPTYSRFKSWHIIAMLLAFYGLMIGGGSVDHLAHIGGILTGLALALGTPFPDDRKPSKEHVWGIVLGVGALMMTLIAAFLCFRSNFGAV